MGRSFVVLRSDCGIRASGHGTRAMEFRVLDGAGVRTLCRPVRSVDDDDFAEGVRPGGGGI